MHLEEVAVYEDSPRRRLQTVKANPWWCLPPLGPVNGRALRRGLETEGLAVAWFFFVCTHLLGKAGVMSLGVAPAS